MNNNNDINDQQGQDADRSGDAGNRLREFERAVDRFLGRILVPVNSNENDTGDEENQGDVDTSDMPPLEHIPNENATTSRDTLRPPAASHSTSYMDVDTREVSEHAPNPQASGSSGNNDDMPALLDVSDSEDSDAEDVEMLVMDDTHTGAGLSHDFASMPALEVIPAQQQNTTQSPLQAVASTSMPASDTTTQVPTPSGFRNSRLSYIEDDPEDMEMQPVGQNGSRNESDSDSVRIGSRRARVEDDDEENGRPSMRSTNNATPVPPTPTPDLSRTATPAIPSNTPTNRPDRPVRPLPRNGPPPLRPNAGPVFDANTTLRQFFSSMLGALSPTPGAQAENVNAPNQPAAGEAASTNANAEPPRSEPSDQPAPSNAPEATGNGATPDNGNGPAQNREGEPDVGFDMFFHFITPDGTVRTHHAGGQGQAQNQNQNGDQQQPQQAAGQEQNRDQNANGNANANANAEPTNGMPPGFGGFIEQFLRAAMAQGGMESERDDPQRARRLVAGLEVVPEGLVKRIERVGGAPGMHENMPGDPGCAICWDSLLQHSDEKKDDSAEEKKDEAEKEKTEEVAAEGALESSLTTLPSYEQAAAAPAPVVQAPGAASESSAPAPDPAELPLPDAAVSGTSPADSQKAQKEEEDSRIVALPCAHVFHAKCLIPWFSRPNQTTCPVCRFNIDPENLTRRSRQFRSQAPSPSPNLARAQPAPQAQAQTQTVTPAQPTARQEAPAQAQQPQPQPEAVPSGSRPATPRPQPAQAQTQAQPQTGPQPQPNPRPQNRHAFTFGIGQPGQLPGGALFTVNFDLVFDDGSTAGGAFGFGPQQNAAPQPQPAQQNAAPQPQAQPQPHPTPTPSEANPQPAATPADATPANNNLQQQNAPTPGNVPNAGAPRDGAPFPPFGLPFNFMPFFFPGINMVPPQPPSQPRQGREPKEWTVPPAPGLTLRERVERKEREAGLRCSDISCGVGPTDEDPTPGVDSSLADAFKQISISQDDGSGKEPVCKHRFHPACLVSAGRSAGWGQEENSSESVEVSCPVCRKTGHIDRAEWDEGVRESMA